MADRTVVAASEIATLRQELAAAEARIREIEDDRFKPFTWWKQDQERPNVRRTANAWLHSIVKLRSGLGSVLTNRNYFSAPMPPSASCGHASGWAVDSNGPAAD
jgi:hypothetical protein